METRLTEAQGHKAPHNLPPALLPKISYNKALRSRFTLDQTIYTVRNCSSEVFKRFIEQCGRQALGSAKWKPLQQTGLLLLLEKDCSDIVRWYALNQLLEHKVNVPLENGEESHTFSQIKG